MPLSTNSLGVESPDRSRALRRASLILLACLLAATTVALATSSERPDDRVTLETARPGATLPIIRTHRYRMAGAIRPLLFWISSDDVGAGQIVWRRSAAGALGYELLIGSDPATAPRGLNRWGYLAEEVLGSTGALLGVISAADDESFEAATSHLETGEVTSAFKTIRATVSPESVNAEVSLVGARSTLTFRDVEAVLSLMHVSPVSVESRVAARPADARSGFLAATVELIHATVRESRASDTSTHARSIPYMYGDGLHELTLKSYRFSARETIGGKPYADVVHGKFETRSRATGERRRFELMYGTIGPLAEVPIWIRYQPRWWLRVELVLETDGTDLRVAAVHP